jgi:hypothetical protein
MMADRQAATFPQRLASGLALLAAALWTGSLWGVGLLAVPVLFQSLADKMMAGMLAGKMFTLVSFTGMACASYLMIYLAAQSGTRALRHPLFLIAATMLLLVMAGEFILQPEMAALKAQALPADVMHSPLSDRFQFLHHVASSLYLVECLLGIALVLKAKRC